MWRCCCDHVRASKRPPITSNCRRACRISTCRLTTDRPHFRDHAKPHPSRHHIPTICTAAPSVYRQTDASLSGVDCFLAGFPVLIRHFGRRCSRIETSESGSPPTRLPAEAPSILCPCILVFFVSALLSPDFSLLPAATPASQFPSQFGAAAASRNLPPPPNPPSQLSIQPVGLEANLARSCSRLPSFLTAGRSPGWPFFTSSGRGAAPPIARANGTAKQTHKRAAQTDTNRRKHPFSARLTATVASDRPLLATSLRPHSRDDSPFALLLFIWRATPHRQSSGHRRHPVSLTFFSH